jgi:hypothetical protein
VRRLQLRGSSTNGWVWIAVRISTQLDLHRCISKMPHTKRECYDRTRLFYLVYLCDHHCSLKYGRPPMTQEWRSLNNPTAFLHCEFSNHRDLGLISQVELWSTTRAVFEQFGADIESTAAMQKLPEVNRFSQAYDQWRQTWCSVLAIGQQSTGVISELHFSCARLYLYSHLHRGRTPNQQLGSTPEANDLINNFKESALSVLRLILDSEVRLLDLPSYFGTMLAFATVSLIKIARDGNASHDLKQDVLHLMYRLRDSLHVIKLPSSCSHPYGGIAKGLEQATEGLQNNHAPTFDNPNDLTFDDNILTDDFWNVDFTDFGTNWMGLVDH